jgi:LuxR family transcriptional regulator, quorum-sensing system regulator CciR
VFDLALIQEFIEATDAARSLSDLEGLLLAITLEMGFDFFALVQHVDLRQRAFGEIVALSNYPEAWIETFVHGDMVSTDPVHLASHRVNIGFDWDRISDWIDETSAHRKVRRLAHHAGVAKGFTVPAHIPAEATGSCSFAVRPGRLLPATMFPMAFIIGAHAFFAARRIIMRKLRPQAPSTKLAPRHLQCLVHWGRGSTDRQTGQALGIAEGTVTEYIDEAKYRLDVGNRVQAIITALVEGRIVLSDLYRKTPR